MNNFDNENYHKNIMEDRKANGEGQHHETVGHLVTYEKLLNGHTLWTCRSCKTDGVSHEAVS